MLDSFQKLRVFYAKPMNVYEGLDGLHQLRAPLLTIGNFDGLHLGHQRIIETLRSLRKPGDGSSERIGVITFEPHPLTVLRPNVAPPRLTPDLMKRALLERAGVDDLVVLPPSQEVLGLSAEEFWAILRDRVRPRTIVEGASFNFGRGRGGTIQHLQRWSERDGVALHVVEAVKVPLLDLQIVEVGSSLIRWLISYGRVRDAAICLGRAYLLRGVVVKGHQRGRTIGVPTANLDCGEQLVPDDGVYAGRCTVGGKSFPAAVNVGVAPTFEGISRRQVEAHLVGFDGDLYSRTLDLELLDWLRSERKFSSLDALKIQLARDIESARERLDLLPQRAIASVA